MARPKKLRESKRTEVINFRCEPDTLEMLKQMKGHAGESYTKIICDCVRAGYKLYVQNAYNKIKHIEYFKEGLKK
jgi:hypothetical protein